LRDATRTKDKDEGRQNLRPSSFILVLALMPPPDEVTAREKFACPACGAQAEWSPSKQKLICPFCGTESPYQLNPSSGAIEEIDLVKTLRELPDSLRGWQAEKRSVRCQSCRAVMVFDPSRVAQNCEILWIAGPGGLQGTQGPDQPAEPAAVSRGGHGRPRADPAMVREQVVRPGQAESAGARGHGARRLPAVLDVRRAGDVPWRAEAGHYYYTTETVPELAGPPRDSAGAARAMGAGRGPRRPLF
jgi:hypothetical protein